MDILQIILHALALWAAYMIGRVHAGFLYSQYMRSQDRIQVSRVRYQELLQKEKDNGN